MTLGKQLSPEKFDNAVVVPVVVVYFGVLSFIGVYLITRLYLTYAFQQTLALLTGVSSTQSIQILKSEAARALASGDNADLLVASLKYEDWSFGPGEQNDVSLNSDMTRVLVRLLSQKAAGSHQSAVAQQLFEVATRAASSPSAKKQLADDVTAGKLTTGIDEVDAKLKSILNAGY